MPLVDLRHHERDPEVRLLLPDSDGFGLVGWRDELGELVACARLTRAGEGELALRALAFRTDDGARALLAGLAEAAPAARIVAEVPVPEDCGFVDGALELDATPDTSPAPGTLRDLEAAIRGAWSRETSDDPDEWSEDNPARGHCAVTALLLRELLGGEILIANVIHNGRRIERHAWNRLPSGLVVDLTRDQFRSGEAFGEAAVEEPMFTDPDRLATLRARVLEALG